MKKNDFNTGAKMGLKLSEDIVQKNSDTMEYLLKSVNKLPECFQEVYDVVTDVLVNQEDCHVEKVFGITKTIDINELEEEEKILLFQILNWISLKYGANENQRQFCRSLLKYLKINANDAIYNSFDGRDISQSVDSIRVQKMMYQIVKEYLYLKSNSNNYGDIYNEILDCFTKDVNNNAVETMIDIKVCLFGVEGLYEQFSTDFDEVVLPENLVRPYINIEKKEYIEISKECASIFFNDKKKRKYNYYCEAASYVVYVENNRIVYLNKKTLEKRLLLEDINNVEDIFKYRRISAYQDVVIFAIENDIYYFDLNSEECGHIREISAIYNEKNQKYKLQNICFSNNKLVYGNKILHILDLDTWLELDIKYQDEFIDASERYVIIDNHIYFLKDASYLKGSFHYGKVIVKCGLLLGNSTNLSNILFERAYEVSSEIFDLGTYKNYIYVVMKSKRTTISYECVYVDVDDGKATPFYIYSKYIYQMNSYNEYLIYIKATKKFSLVAHDFLHDKAKKIVKDYGDYNYSLIEKVLPGRPYIPPATYMIMGKWVCYSPGFCSSYNKVISVN